MLVAIKIKELKSFTLQRFNFHYFLVNVFSTLSSVIDGLFDRQFQMKNLVASTFIPTANLSNNCFSQESVICWAFLSHKHGSIGVFRTQLNIHERRFCKNSELKKNTKLLLAVNCSSECYIDRYFTESKIHLQGGVNCTLKRFKPCQLAGDRAQEMKEPKLGVVYIIYPVGKQTSARCLKDVLSKQARHLSKEDVLNTNLKDIFVRHLEETFVRCIVDVSQKTS